MRFSGPGTEIRHRILNSLFTRGGRKGVFLFVRNFFRAANPCVLCVLRFWNLNPRFLYNIFNRLFIEWIKKLFFVLFKFSSDIIY